VYRELAFPGTPIFSSFSAHWFGSRRQALGLPVFKRDEKRCDGEMNFWISIFATALLPLIAFLFSRAVTKTFNERYVIAAAIGMSALLAVGFRDSLVFRRTVPLLALLASALLLGHRPYYFEEFDRLAVFQQLPGPYPIVIADGVQFLPLAESAPPDIRSRLVYLTLPPEVPVGDPTNQHQIERWKAINPQLPVEGVSAFLASHPKFYVMDTRSSDDTPATYLLEGHLIQLAAQSGEVLIYKSRLPSEPAGW